MHGQFVWYELTTPDPDAAIRFYPRFTGWGTQAFDKNYTMWTSGGVPFAGLFPQTPEMKAQGVPPNWMPYIETSDVDAAAAKAKSLGATVITGPDDIPGTGRFAVIQDPQGAVFGIYKSSNQSRAWDGTPVLGRPSWHELMTSDHQKAAQFYSALFGWQKISETDMGDGLMYYIFGFNGNMYGGMFTTPKEMAGMHPFWLVYINVKDVGKAVDIATKNGASVQRPQMDIPGGSIAILGDPQGAGFAVHHVSATADAPKPALATKVKSAVSSAIKAAMNTAAKIRPASKKKAAARKKAKAKARPARTTAKAAPRKKVRAAPRKKAKAASRARARTAPRAKAKSAPRRKTKSAPRRRAKAKK